MFFPSVHPRNRRSSRKRARMVIRHLEVFWWREAAERKHGFNLPVLLTNNRRCSDEGEDLFVMVSQVNLLRSRGEMKTKWSTSNKTHIKVEADFRNSDKHNRNRFRWLIWKLQFIARKREVWLNGMVQHWVMFSSRGWLCCQIVKEVVECQEWLSYRITVNLTYAWNMSLILMAVLLRTFFFLVLVLVSRGFLFFIFSPKLGIRPLHLSYGCG